MLNWMEPLMFLAGVGTGMLIVSVITLVDKLRYEKEIY